MTFHHKLLVAAILATSAIVPAATSEAGRISIEIGDRPYYNRGPYYVQSGYRYVWVPGHWSRNRRHWIHGRYVKRNRDRNWIERRHRTHRAILFGR